MQRCKPGQQIARGQITRCAEEHETLDHRARSRPRAKVTPLAMTPM
jgi:hypothetical protein